MQKVIILLVVAAAFGTAYMPGRSDPAASNSPSE